MAPRKPANTQTLFDEMKVMREQGKTINQIAEHYHVSKQYVSYVFRKHDSPLRIAIKNSDLRELGSIQKVVEKYGITESHARARLNRIGIVLPRKPRAKYLHWPKELVESMYQDYKDGLDQKAVAAKYGTSQSMVSDLFKYHQLPTNKRGWPDGKPRKYL